MYICFWNWIKKLLFSIQAENCESNTDVLKKTGLLSLLIVAVISGQTIFQFVLPVNKDTFHLIKDFTTNLILFVLLPLLLIVCNKNMSKFILQIISESKIYRFCNRSLNLVNSVKSICKTNVNRVDILTDNVQYKINIWNVLEYNFTVFWSFHSTVVKLGCQR